MAFVSLPLNPGPHRVDLSYRPPLLSAGAFLSALAALTMLGLSFKPRA